MLRRPGYREAVDWIASNDDCYWLGDHDGHGLIMSVTASMVCDLWGVTDTKLCADLVRALRKAHPSHEALRTTFALAIHNLPTNTSQH
jgi:hypothetical protein